ncbi:MAG TPA: succinyl-diaminopimelate desuccinylase [Xanthobacteraceae bacterium]
MANARDPVEIARELIRCKSVTPAEGGALTYLEKLLKSAGFEVERVKFSEPGTPDVENLFARLGKAGPNLAFAGHTDVVPTGDETSWKHPPFGGEVEGGMLYGRGAVDMKGAIACFAAAALDYVAKSKPKGSISFLITGDEEGPSINGTKKLLAWAAARGEKFDHCFVGEPTSTEVVGDAIKIGRRGSLSATLTTFGKQGHVAYPQRAANPIRPLLRMLAALQNEPFDQGSPHFEPSHLEITSIDVGNPAVNVIPAEAHTRFNIRFNEHHTSQSLRALIEQRCKTAAEGSAFRLSYEPASESFVTAPGSFVEILSRAVTESGGKKPTLSTSGGTSDARYIKDYCPVLELGLVGRTMHAIDEHAPVEDLKKLTAIYRRAIELYFAG